MTTPKTIPSIPYIAASGGAGCVPAWGRPDLLVAAPGGIANLTPANSIYSASNTISLVAQQDIQLLAESRHAMASKDGFVAYTYGKVGNASKPGQETGIHLHAASGSVSVQSQSGQTRLTADKGVSVSSTAGKVRITAPKSILMTAGGAGIDLQAGSITLKGPGKVEFKAAMKVLAGAASATLPDVKLGASSLRDQKYHLQFVARDSGGQPLASKGYVLLMPDGSHRAGKTDGQGMTEKIVTDGPQNVNIYIEDAEHEGFYASEE